MRLETYPTWKANRKTRKPLRTALELAAEHNLSMAQLRGYLAGSDAPKPEMTNRNGGCYYEPIAFRKWIAKKLPN
jgi:hypothetical protein